MNNHNTDINSYTIFILTYIAQLAGAVIICVATFIQFTALFPATK